MSVHGRSTLSNTEKLVYLQHALKDGSAKTIIEGLSQSGEQYTEAVKCLTDRFDRPRLIHQAHVKMIVDASPIRDGSGRELRRLHDVVQQHVRALKSMELEPSPSFITSLIELKLDATTMFEWQRHTQAQNEVPHYQEMLKFLDSRAQASEISTPPKKKSDTPRKPWNPKPVNSFTANCDTTSQCPLCKTEKHPLYSCQKFRSSSHDKKLTVVKSNNICLNCLSKGHFAADCKSIHRCKKCQGPHHTLLHDDQLQRREPEPVSRNPSTANDSGASSHTAATAWEPCSLLMTCQVLVISPSGASLRVRALLDSGSSTSFISERLVQALRLPRTKRCVEISGIGGTIPNLSAQSVTNFKISPTANRGNLINVTALILPKVTRDLPTHPVKFDANWTISPNFT